MAGLDPAIHVVASWWKKRRRVSPGQARWWRVRLPSRAPEWRRLISRARRRILARQIASEW